MHLSAVQKKKEYIVSWGLYWVPPIFGKLPCNSAEQEFSVTMAGCDYSAEEPISMDQRKHCEGLGFRGKYFLFR